VNTKSRVFLAAVCIVIPAIIGCDAMARKFIRKPKQDTSAQEEMVIVPEEYNIGNISKEELYREYFLFWKSWQDELIEALMQKKSQKKQIDCAQEGLKNLNSLKGLLNQDAKDKLDIYIKRLQGLKEAISKDLYGSNALGYAHDAERLRIDILQKFSYDKIKDNLL